MRLDDGADPVGKRMPSPASLTGTLQERRRLMEDMSAASTDLSLLNCLSLLHLSLRKRQGEEVEGLTTQKGKFRIC